jgi:hypothetical protein
VDLHAWITQQVNRVEALAQGASPSPWRYDLDEGEVRAEDGIAVAEPFALSSRQLQATGQHIATHGPDAVLRRCEADRRILARHRADSSAAAFPGACEGCGLDDWGLPNVETINDCPELLDLAHAHGVTEEILAGLDRPQPPEPEPRNDGRLGLADILAPRTRMRDVPPALRGPNWNP